MGAQLVHRMYFACTLHMVAEGSAIDVQIGGVGSPTNKGSPIDLQISG